MNHVQFTRANMVAPTKIELIKGDITEINADVIVNPANHTLLGGGGVDGRIHYRAGSGLLEECGTLGGCQKGEAKITMGHRLPAKCIIHTVGPIFGMENGAEERILNDCYTNSLCLASQHNLRVIAFPTIGTGAFRFPKDRAAIIVKKTLEEYLIAHPNQFDKIIFVLFDDLDYKIYQILYQGLSDDLNIETLRDDSPQKGTVKTSERIC